MTTTLVAAQPQQKCFCGARRTQLECFHNSMISETIESWEIQKQELEQEYPYPLSIV
jgi:hypothetical protein